MPGIRDVVFGLDVLWCVIALFVVLFVLALFDSAL